MDQLRQRAMDQRGPGGCVRRRDVHADRPVQRLSGVSASRQQRRGDLSADAERSCRAVSIEGKVARRLNLSTYAWPAFEHRIQATSCRSSDTTGGCATPATGVDPERERVEYLRQEQQE